MAEAPPLRLAGRNLSRVPMPVLLGVLAGVYRVLLTWVYAGWEEGDFGYLGLTRGVLDSNFTFWEMDETPLYFILSALVLALVGDARQATLAVSISSGVAAVVLGFLLARALFGQGIAVVVGLALCFQPELALYSATAMREPLYAALVLGAFVCLVERRAGRAGGLLGASVLVRFDTLVTNVPAALHLAWRSREGKTAAWRILGVVAAVTVAWAAYCQVVHGTWRFFGGAVSKNLASAEGQDLAASFDRTRLGVTTSLALFFRILPRKVGWPLLLGAAWHCVAALRGRVRGPEVSLALATALNVAAWLGLGFISRYEPDHNLYWKWALLSAVLVCVSGVRGLQLAAREWLPDRRGPLAAALAAATLLTVAPFVSETLYQVERSRETVSPYVSVGRWIEANVPEKVPMILDGIPRMWLDRKANERPLVSWIEVKTRPGDPVEFGRYVLDRRIDYVLWFNEVWTDAPRVAPFLGGEHPVEAGPVGLVPVLRDPRAGFVFYRVDDVSELPGAAGAPPS